MSKLSLISAVFIVFLTFYFEFNFSNASSDDQDGFVEIEEEHTGAVDGGSCGLQNEDLVWLEGLTQSQQGKKEGDCPFCGTTRPMAEKFMNWSQQMLKDYPILRPILEFVKKLLDYFNGNQIADTPNFSY